jgi:hypothetical protein
LNKAPSLHCVKCEAAIKKVNCKEYGEGMESYNMK